jgi:hypothetical protein
LNAKVLVAHSETKLRQYREAEQTFDEALVLAKDQRKFYFKRKQNPKLLINYYSTEIKNSPSENVLYVA